MSSSKTNRPVRRHLSAADPRDTPTIETEFRRVVIGQDMSAALGRHVCATCAKLTAADGNLPITLLFACNGGDVFSAGHLIDGLRALGVPLQAVITRNADSCALDVFLECDERFVLEHALALPHHTRSEFSGIARSREQLERETAAFVTDLWRTEQRAQKRMRERTGLSLREIRAILRIGEDTQMPLDAVRLVELGFAKKILCDFRFTEPHPLLEPWHESFRKGAETSPPAS